MCSAVREPRMAPGAFLLPSYAHGARDEQALRLVAAALGEWWAFLEEMPADLGDILCSVLKRHEADLRSRYMKQIDNDPEMAAVLSGDSGRQELLARLLDWMEALFRTIATPNEEILLEQIELGELMARIGYPPQGISAALRRFKVWFIKTLSEMPMSRQHVFKVTAVFVALIDLSLELRSYGYQRCASNDTRTTETYRLYSLGQNLAMERERQRALLMEWSHQLLSSLYQHSWVTDLPRVWNSEFGLWLKHKAMILFENDEQLKAVRASADRIDLKLIPGFERPSELDRTEIAMWLNKVDAEISVIKNTLGNLFEMHLEVENGRDPLTKLLNRRFLPVVMKKEFQLLKAGRSSGLSVLLLDIDHFKRINDSHGHQVGDIALQAVANLVCTSIRSSDFAFRFGGEEILILMVDCGLSVAQATAEQIRLKIQNMPIELSGGGCLTLTVSVGLVCYEGEFDYMRLIERADSAMYAAKAHGRNCTWLESGSA